MERRPKVTPEVVATACQQLIKDGKNVSVNAVIGITGGSFSTVGQLVKAWREQQREKAAPALEMPDSVSAAMREASQTIWAAASALAADTIENVQKQAQEAADKANTELQEYASEVSRLESKVSSSESKVDALEKSLHESRAETSEHSTQIASLQARLGDRDTELQRLRADYEKLQAELIEIAKNQGRSKKKGV